MTQRETDRQRLPIKLGSTWRLPMRDRESAAHALGKLFKHP